jgi:Deoxycytidine deaminase
MIYSNKDILDGLEAEHIEILNFSRDCMRPSSYLLRIDAKLLKMKPTDSIIDTKSTNTSFFFDDVIMSDSGLVINPGEFYLASSVEKISLDSTVCGDLFQLSCYARIGLNINFSSCHIAATFGVGRPSAITFEIINNSPNKIKIYPGVKFCHLRFTRHVTPSSVIYTGIYSERDEAMASDFELKPAK